MKASIYDFTKTQLTEWLVDQGQKKYRGQQIWDWLYKKHVRGFAEMSNLPSDLVANLTENFSFSPLKPLVVQQASDKTTKYLFQLEDGLMIETVLMYMEYGLSVCVTSQVGCNIGCTFCASGLIRKQRDLTAGEIVAQIMQVQHNLDDQGKGERVGHVVVMGIGEPFDNFDNVMNFIDVIKDQSGLAIGARHITVSTSGLANKIKEFADRDMQVNLAISLHAPNNDLRSRIMRINRTWPLEKLFDAINYYIDKTNRRVTFEYIMLNDVNDHVAEAKQLVTLLRPLKKLAYVNLIPYNPVSEHGQYARSSKKAIARFYDTLMQGGINCVVRKEHGTDIDAACGQLRSNEMKKRQKIAR
ncbi:23S rRNA (adenine(2503)-C(2))-methyltransferase RlmN [Agrilactobacillus fermenti]|uniref:23S rRNA (adenine(2503)-C(2))-methyltransferase RlmN n=1 Tax=Agrilactobacillus fermenti TaxID=2586909 RepID=UPI001E472E0B|nr:23S rRNA (adenine(2503)-C(2))-methyltransferase RlmN [Agrilactobacillus fermenti]MCD2255974.1 23S rRNA (adenine(2503)-C(2))-methyltransferase RlmN [Agrilactobacillus fermenti]